MYCSNLSLPTCDRAHEIAAEPQNLREPESPESNEHKKDLHTEQAKPFQPASLRAKRYLSTSVEKMDPNHPHPSGVYWQAHVWQIAV
mmetsp:Transcript_27292/g.61613  ORF Transcript_27292/g.61613 Transcript_27292/m.61613 type:complete len:87 (-) Transcript_27292:710-970(-)